MVEELRMPGADKGDSVHRFMQTAAFMGARPVFAGDDVTDEDGFAEVDRLGGFGVLVGRMRPTAGAFRPAHGRRPAGLAGGCDMSRLIVVSNRVNATHRRGRRDRRRPGHGARRGAAVNTPASGSAGAARPLRSSLAS
jgi:hypothetical protein